MGSLSSMGDLHPTHRLPAQFPRDLATDLVPLLVLERPGPFDRIESHPHRPLGPHDSDAVRAVVQRELAPPVHQAWHSMRAHQIPDLLEGPRSILPGPGRRAGPNGSGSDKPPGGIAPLSRDNARVARDPSHPVAVAARRLDPQVQGSHHCLPTPCDRSTTPLAWGQRGGLARTATPSPANQQTRSVGRSPRDPQGAPLSTRSPTGRPQRWNARLRLV